MSATFIAGIENILYFKWFGILVVEQDKRESKRWVKNRNIIPPDQESLSK